MRELWRRDKQWVKEVVDGRAVALQICLHHCFEKWNKNTQAPPQGEGVIDLAVHVTARFNANALMTGQMGHKLNELNMFVEVCDLVNNVVVACLRNHQALCLVC